jgi:hypothetical protein
MRRSSWAAATQAGCDQHLQSGFEICLVICCDLASAGLSNVSAGRVGSILNNSLLVWAGPVLWQDKRNATF